MTAHHSNHRIVTAGVKPADARLAVILIHGRGGSPEDMLGFAGRLGTGDITYIAPEAAGHSWWPNSFLAPLVANEPGLSSGLSVIDNQINYLNSQGLSDNQIIIAGFSQGGCLALEYVARSGRSLLAGLGFSSALVGNVESGKPPVAELYNYSPKGFDYDGSNLAGVDVFIGCHEHDPHIPLARVKESADVFKKLGASVTKHVYPGSGHGITEDEISFFQQLVK